MGGLIGSRFGPIGSAVGGTLGQLAGSLGEELIEGKSMSTFGGGTPFTGNPSAGFDTKMTRMVM